MNTLTTLTTRLGVDAAVRLMSTDSFCASIDKLLPHLATLKTELGVETAVKLFCSDSFCSHIESLVPRLPELKRILGLDGILVIFSNNSIPSMNGQQWIDFMKFIEVAKKEHVMTFTKNMGCVSKCKKYGWDIALIVYKDLTSSKTQRGFPKALIEYAYAINLQ